MIDKIKNELYSIKGKRINIKINNIRNKEEKYYSDLLKMEENNE